MRIVECIMYNVSQLFNFQTYQTELEKDWLIPFYMRNHFLKNQSNSKITGICIVTVRSWKSMQDQRNSDRSPPGGTCEGWLEGGFFGLEALKKNPKKLMQTLAIYLS